MRELLDLIYGNKIEEFKSRLQASPQMIKEQDSDGNTPLLYAAAYGKLDLIQWLLSKGSSIKEVDKENYNVLFIAAVNNYINIVRWLLATYPQDFNEDMLNNHTDNQVQSCYQALKKQEVKSLAKKIDDVKIGKSQIHSLTSSAKSPKLLTRKQLEIDTDYKEDAKGQPFSPAQNIRLISEPSSAPPVFSEDKVMFQLLETNFQDIENLPLSDYVKKLYKRINSPQKNELYEKEFIDGKVSIPELENYKLNWNEFYQLAKNLLSEQEIEQCKTEWERNLNNAKNIILLICMGRSNKVVENITRVYLTGFYQSLSQPVKENLVRFSGVYAWLNALELLELCLSEIKSPLKVLFPDRSYQVFTSKWDDKQQSQIVDIRLRFCIHTQTQISPPKDINAIIMGHLSITKNENQLKYSCNFKLILSNELKNIVSTLKNRFKFVELDDTLRTKMLSEFILYQFNQFRFSKDGKKSRIFNNENLPQLTVELVNKFPLIHLFMINGFNFFPKKFFDVMDSFRHAFLHEGRLAAWVRSDSIDFIARFLSVALVNLNAADQRDQLIGALNGKVTEYMTAFQGPIDDYLLKLWEQVFDRIANQVRNFSDLAPAITPDDIEKIILKIENQLFITQDQVKEDKNLQSVIDKNYHLLELLCMKDSQDLISSLGPILKNDPLYRESLFDYLKHQRTLFDVSLKMIEHKHVTLFLLCWWETSGVNREYDWRVLRSSVNITLVKSWQDILLKRSSTLDIWFSYLLLYLFLCDQIAQKHGNEFYDIIHQIENLKIIDKDQYMGINKYNEFVRKIKESVLNYRNISFTPIELKSSAIHTDRKFSESITQRLLKKSGNDQNKVKKFSIDYASAIYQPYINLVNNVLRNVSLIPALQSIQHLVSRQKEQHDLLLNQWNNFYNYELKMWESFSNINKQKTLDDLKKVQDKLKTTMQELLKLDGLERVHKRNTLTLLNNERKELTALISQKESDHIKVKEYTGSIKSGFEKLSNLKNEDHYQAVINDLDSDIKEISQMDQLIIQYHQQRSDYDKKTLEIQEIMKMTSEKLAVHGPRRFIKQLDKVKSAGEDLLKHEAKMIATRMNLITALRFFHAVFDRLNLTFKIMVKSDADKIDQYIADWQPQSVLSFLFVGAGDNWCIYRYDHRKDQRKEIKFMRVDPVLKNELRTIDSKSYPLYNQRSPISVKFLYLLLCQKNLFTDNHMFNQKSVYELTLRIYRLQLLQFVINDLYKKMDKINLLTETKESKSVGSLIR